MSSRNATAGPRRVNIERGIYYRDAPRGRVYEFNYQDSDGRTRWQTVVGGLKDARRERAEIVAKLGRGERVAPTRQTFADVATAWLEAQGGRLRPRTREVYETQLRLHVMPRFGRRRIADVNEDDIASLIAEMHVQGYAAWTIRGVLTPFGRVLGYAARRGLIPTNPIRKLERGERPTGEPREMRVLDRSEIASLLDAASPKYRTLLAASVFLGLRQGELLGLTWADIDFEASVVRVRKQLDRSGTRVEPKTPKAIRDVVLMPTLGRLLREHKLRSPFTAPSDYVFTTSEGTPYHWRNISRRGFEKAKHRAGLDREGRPRLRFHDLRHTYASILVAQGENVVYVSRQLGHASVKQTLDTYAHLIDRAEHAQRASDRLETSFGGILRSGSATEFPAEGG